VAVGVGVGDCAPWHMKISVKAVGTPVIS
jgi:hypothetical protein